MEGFEVGDSVICTGKGKSSWFDNITIGRVYKVIEMKPYTNGFYIYDDVGQEWLYDYNIYFISIKKHRSEVIDNILEYGI